MNREKNIISTHHDCLNIVYLTDIYVISVCILFLQSAYKKIALYCLVLYKQEMIQYVVMLKNFRKIKQNVLFPKI